MAGTWHGSDRPKLRDLREHVVEWAACKWRELGVVLLPYHFYALSDGIGSTMLYDDKCCMSVFQRWLDTTVDATWDQLIRALKSVELNYLADRLEQMIIREMSATDSDSVVHDESSGDSGSTIIKESLTCPVCYELYKNPKYLSCHHSYCEQCLEEMQVESKIICPECRSQSAVPAGGVKDLPADFRIKSMMDKLGIKRREGDEVLKCNECDEDEPVVAYCQMCNSYFCQFCREHHKRSKKYRGHRTVTVAKLKSSKHVNVKPKAVFLTCKDHHIELSWYCETCKQLICKHCVAKSHCSHSYAKARLQACKCQIDLEAIAPVKTVVEDVTETRDATDEIKKNDMKDSLPTKEDTAGTTFVMHAAGPYQISFNGESGGCFVWNDHGLEIYFPSRCSQRHVQIAASTFLPIKNEIYPGTHIVSAVYQFNCDIERFDKKFTLCLQHCVKLQSPEDCQKMCFVVVQDDRGDIKYGHFEVGKSYGTVTLDRFCHIFIAWVHELQKTIRIAVLSLLGDQDNSSPQIQAPSNQQSNNSRLSSEEACVEELSTSQSSRTGSSQSATGQDHGSSAAVTPNSSMVDATSPPYKYEAMIGLPKEDHHSTDSWSCYYSIYHDIGTWRQVCQEAIQIKEPISNCAINYYYGGIEFDTGGVASITCGQTSEDTLIVDSSPSKIEKEEVDKKYETYVNICKRHPLYYSSRDDLVQRIIVKSHICVTKTSNEQLSNCLLITEGITPQQQIDLCTGYCYNLTLIKPHGKNGPVPASGLKASNIRIDISPCLKQSRILYEKPKVKDLLVMGVVSQLAAEWETVAYLLEYDTPKIDNIKTLKRENPEKCCRELLRDWVEDKPDDAPKTWFTLLNTIAEYETFTRSIEKILENLEKKYAS